ncbi:MAG: hypothetical protein AB1861_12875 [Cyanobacteriota bacterium]
MSDRDIQRCYPHAQTLSDRLCRRRCKSVAFHLLPDGSNWVGRSRLKADTTMVVRPSPIFASRRS